MADVSRQLAARLSSNQIIKTIPRDETESGIGQSTASYLQLGGSYFSDSRAVKSIRDFKKLNQ